METMTFCVPCLFGLEGLVGDELRRLELSNVRVEDRRVFFEGDFEKIPHQKPCIFKAFGGFWGIGELFLYIYMKCFYNIYKDCEKKAPNPPLLAF